MLSLANPMLALALLALGPDVAPEPGAWSVTRLDLDVIPMPDMEITGIEGTLYLRLEGGASTGPVLALNSRADLMRFVSVDAPHGAHVEYDVEIPDRPSTTALRIVFDEPRAPGTEIEVGFVCESGAQGSQFEVRSEIAFASWVEAWYPTCADRLLAGEDVSLSSLLAAPGVTRFHLPEGWDALSNGLRRASDDAPDVVTFEVRQPVARSFTAGPYETTWHEVDGRRIGLYLLSQKQFDPRKQVEMLAAALAAQEARFGPYPYASYAIAEVPESTSAFYASSEQGFIMARSSAFAYAHGNLPLWGHEMAHGWWGNLVGSDGPGSLLCSESLAQFSALLAIEAVEGDEAAREFLRFSRSGYSHQQCARGYFRIVDAGNDTPLSQLDSGALHHTLSDAKGHWMYDMLRRRVGEERFFEGLRGLIARYTDKRMTLDDVRAHFVALAPDARLEPFFEQWLDRTGAPELDVEWSEGERGVELVVRQIQEGEPYDLVLDVAIERGDEVERTTVDVRERETRIDVAAGVTGVRLDPDHRLLLRLAEYAE